MSQRYKAMDHWAFPHAAIAALWDTTSPLSWRDQTANGHGSRTMRKAGKWHLKRSGSLETCTNEWWWLSYMVWCDYIMSSLFAFGHCRSNCLQHQSAHFHCKSPCTMQGVTISMSTSPNLALQKLPHLYQCVKSHPVGSPIGQAAVLLWGHQTTVFVFEGSKYQKSAGCRNKNSWKLYVRVATPNKRWNTDHIHFFHQGAMLASSARTHSQCAALEHITVLKVTLQRQRISTPPAVQREHF